MRLSDGCGSRRLEIPPEYPVIERPRKADGRNGRNMHEEVDQHSNTAIIRSIATLTTLSADHIFCLLLPIDYH